MAIENIDGTPGGTGVYNTKMPGLAENANIQTALRLYHYGTDTVPSNLSLVSDKSIAGYFKAVSSRVTNLETQGIGSTYQTTEPTTTDPAGLPDGYIWVDESSVAPVTPDFIAKYQSSTPSGTFAVGALWVDSDSTPLKMYVYSGTTWREIGA